MNTLKELISNLSNYWKISPDKVVGRLNSMNEREIKNIVNKMIKKFNTGGVVGQSTLKRNVENEPILSASNGNMLTRKQSRLLAKDNGLTRSQWNLAYANSKNGLRSQGLRGADLRAQARRQAAGINTQPVAQPRLTAPAATLNTQPLAGPTAMSSAMEDQYSRLMSKRANAMATAEAAGKFGDAFNIARNAGLTSFRWNGKDYTTQTSEEANRVNTFINNSIPAAKFDFGFGPIVKPEIPEMVETYEEDINEEPFPQYVAKAPAPAMPAVPENLAAPEEGTAYSTPAASLWYPEAPGVPVAHMNTGNVSRATTPSAVSRMISLPNGGSRLR